MEVGKKLTLYTYTHVREDILALYGFPTLNELEFFELLISVSGIGPKMALSIMSLADLSVIKSGIVNQDASVFTKVSGVGRKTAERLIVELKEKILPGEVEGTVVAVSQEQADVIDVLEALGYSRAEALEAMLRIPGTITDSQERIREALRSLARQ